MATDYLPRTDADLVAWTTNFSTRISAAPTSVGLVAGQATTYAALSSGFVSANATAVNPGTRTKATIQAKNDARRLLKANARLLAKIIQAYPSLTNTQRVELGLTVPSGEAHPINPPTDAPMVEVLSVFGRTMKLRLHSATSETRGKPDGVAGASIFTHVGATAPINIEDWVFQGSMTRCVFDLEFNESTPPGSQVWITAFWYSPRAQSGPASAPISTYLGGGVALAA